MKKNEIGTYEIEILNEYGHIIHCHCIINGWRSMAEENAVKSCKFWGGAEWRVIKIG